MKKPYIFCALLLAPLALFWFLLYKTTVGNSLYALFSAIVVIFIAGAAAVVLTKMLTNEIDLKLLISEDNGNASLSRFQFLLFTFVIASSYFLVVVWGLTDPEGIKAMTQAIAAGKPILPDVPTGVLGLIGISGGSYVIAKGIQKSAGSGDGSIQAIVVAHGGAGYGAQTTVKLTGGGGSGATAAPVIDGGVITGVHVTAAGTGYSAAPTVEFVDPGIPPGTGANATAVV